MTEIGYQRSIPSDSSSCDDFTAAVHFQTAAGNLQFDHPLCVITASTLADVVLALAEVERASADGYWAVGYVAYEAAPAFDVALRVRQSSTLPLLAFGIFDKPAPTHRVDAVPDSEPPGPWSTSLSAADHAASVDRIREAIAGGYTYQVNYTMRIRAKFPGDNSNSLPVREEPGIGSDRGGVWGEGSDSPFPGGERGWGRGVSFYERLRRSQQAPYAAYLSFGRHRILSASPELFFHRQGSRIVTRPMKGTSPRGLWTEQDNARREWLAASEKNRAENVMIVDLLRNDLGRIATPGSVKVDDLFTVEAYPTVFQMTSTISATLRPSTTLVDIFRALFPCGSVTGAPKVSTMALIADLETESRGVYCGAIGYLAPGGETVFNVAIRTVTIDIDEGVATYGTGGGITWDSDAADEYREAAAKAAILSDDRPDFDFLETLCLRDGAYVLLDRHLQRLIASTDYFAIDIDEAVVRANLSEYASQHPDGAHRVRLLVSQTGAIVVEGQPLGPPPSTALVAVATEPVDSSDRFLYHKTTHRAVYERHRKQFPSRFDVLLWNERGEATEFTIGNLVAEIDGVRWTPPIESGLLPGTMRAEALSTGEIRERILTLDDVKRASRLWLINSVRGWVPVTLANTDSLS